LSFKNGIAAKILALGHRYLVVTYQYMMAPLLLYAILREQQVDLEHCHDVFAYGFWQ
jgi:hypothetical protein